jgi:hypothetical protein
VFGEMTPGRADARRYWDGKNLSGEHKAAISEGQKAAHARKKAAINKAIREVLPIASKPARLTRRQESMVEAITKGTEVK